MRLTLKLIDENELNYIKRFFKLKFWAKLTASETADFQSIFACSASAVIPGEKTSTNPNRKSPTRFPISLRWTSHIALMPQRGTQNRKTDVFRVKLHLAWRSSATKFLCVNTVGDKVVSHSPAYLSVQKCRAKDVPYYVKIGPKVTNLLQKMPFF